MTFQQPKMLQYRFAQSIILWLFTSVIIHFLGCKKTDNVNQNIDNSLIINSFIIEKKNNPQLSEDVVFEIKGNNIIGKLKYYHFDLIPTFTTNASTVEITSQPQTSAVTRVDFRKNIIYTLTSTEGGKREYNLIVNWDDNLPQLHISTDRNVNITSKSSYITANIDIKGQSIFSDFKSPIQIKGRGNTTWTYPKKPFKIKLDSKAALLGMAAEKDWILLANYLDETHMLNAIAMKTGQLLNMPFTNHIEPVEIILNGQYQGLYMLTEQIEVKKNRVNIGDDGILLQLDKNFDDMWKFKSTYYQLPVMIMHPELTNSSEIMPIKTQLEQLESLMASADFPKNNYLDFIDAESIVNYFITYMLTDNEELNHPKSTYLYKTNTGKWHLGPIWDFDWAFGYEGSQVHFNRADKSLFWANTSEGTRFFFKFMTDPYIKSLLKQRWVDFKNTKLSQLYTYIDDYAFMIEGAKVRDYQKWQRGSGNFKGDVSKLKIWLQDRTRYMDSYINSL